MTIKTVERDFHDAPRPVRVRFAPTVPDGGGAFLHCGHLAMLIMAAHVAQENNCPLDFRFDGAPDIIGALDCMNAVAWLSIPIRRFYVLPVSNNRHVEMFAKGDKALAAGLTNWHLSSSYDDLYVENRTIIVRGIEFKYKPIRDEITDAERVWGTQPFVELLYPLMMRDGQKMSKSLDNGVHWSVLKEFRPEKVTKVLLEFMENSNDYYEFRDVLKRLANDI